MFRHPHIHTYVTLANDLYRKMENLLNSKIEILVLRRKLQQEVFKGRKGQKASFRGANDRHERKKK